MSIITQDQIPEIGVDALALLLQNPNQEKFIDVREPQEVAIAYIPGFINLPLSQFGAWAPRIHEQFPVTDSMIVLCHHGIRSAQVCYWLMQQGGTNLSRKKT